MTGHTNEAIERWADEIAALGGSEPLTRFRDAKVGTLDLQAADEETRRLLLAGEPVRVSRLFPHGPLRTSASRSAHRLGQRLWRLETGHGIAAGYLATGLATWNDPTSTRRPNVPILLRRMQVLPVGFADPDLMLHIVGEPELNPRLLEAMADQLGLRVSPSDLLDPSGELRYAVVVERLREHAPPHVVDGFAIEHRAVIGLMSLVPETVAADLRNPENAMAHRALVALAAGLESPVTMRGQQVAAGADQVQAPPIDLDSTQQRVLDAVRMGDSLVVEAPAGTGATQVAAGLCAQAVTAGRSVLVVADATPRLRGLRRRLAAIGLGGATMDLADGLISSTGLARVALSSVDGAATRSGPGSPASPSETRSPRPTDADPDRARLSGYVNALHEHRQPRALSAYQAISAAHTGPADQQTTVRIDPDSLTRLDAAALDRLRQALATFVDLNGLVISPTATAWFGAAPATEDDAEQAVAMVDRLRTDLIPRARDAGSRAAAEVGVPAPTSLSELQQLASLLDDVRAVEQVFDRAVWSEPADRLAAATVDRHQRRSLADPPGLRERRALRATVRSLLRDVDLADDSALVSEMLSRAADVRARWADKARDGRLPRIGENGPAAIAATAEVTSAISALRDVHPDALPDDLDLAGTQARLAALAAEVHWARRLPRLNKAAATMADAGIGPVVAVLRERMDAGDVVTPEAAVAVLESSVAASLAEEIERADPVLSGATGAELRASSERWRQADAGVVVAAADVAHNAWAQRVRKAGTERPVQVRALREALAGRIPSTPRDLLSSTWETVISSRPIWLAGPLAAAATLPVDASFDLVVILDGQSMALAHAIGLLARTEQIVVLGDSAQIPPAPTPLSIDAPDPRSSPQLPGSGVETPSVYTVLRDQLPAIDLVVRYGCRDARLQVAMPALRTPTTVAVPPGAGAAPLTLTLAVQQQGSRDQEESVTTEVDLVVELVKKHVSTRPGTSLAVLTLGPAHAAAIEAALGRACFTDASLAQFLGPEADEPFLLLPVEQLCGERRDTVILSVGFGRTMDGRLLYRFGPLNRPGGIRWLSTAVGTARRELALVSSLAATDLEPRRLAADGLWTLRQLLAAGEGIALEDGFDPATHAAVAPRLLDPLERNIAERLHRARLPVVAGSGSGMLAVPLGLEHPGRPGRNVLAIEPEGGVFGSIHRLRDRERMRPEQLMRAGWSVYRLCVIDWARDPDAEIERIRAAWQTACVLADAIDAARNAPAEPPGTPSERGKKLGVAGRPNIAVGRPVDVYPTVDLVTLAAWIDESQPGIGEDDAVAELAREIGVAHPTGRVDLVLRRAVRAARIVRAPERSAAAPETASVAAPDAAADETGAQAEHQEPADGSQPDDAEPDGGASGGADSNRTGSNAGETATATGDESESVQVDDPLPTMAAADATERAQERIADEAAHEAWLEDERPPHH